ncbi:porin [Duganella radicis]|uniref:Porin n=1 Tax=Duganella radicis TaxID=551988 RepID=A0A6L6PH85_9BURK|nr:porin [Duganella radicis]MTV38343.1 porin [Duganella radicis]
MRSHQTVLLACAVLGALAMAAPARAQSSVSVNGMLDLGLYRGFDGVTQIGTVQRSNLAISGVEDLGGGVKAVFRLSTRFEMDTGASEGAGYKPFWHDESTIGLKGAWGTVRAGRAMTAMWANDWKFDPWCNYNRIASPAWQHWHYLTPSDPFANNGTAEYGRLNNGVFYDSPTVGDFTVRLSGTPERDPRGATRPVSAVLEYGQGAWAGMAAYERNSIGDKDYFAAGKYSFGDAAIMAAYDDSRELATNGRSRAYTVSASYKMDQRVTLKTGYSLQRLNGVDNRYLSFGADYALSRRSTLYFSVGHQHTTSTGFGMAHIF